MSYVTKLSVLTTVTLSSILNFAYISKSKCIKLLGYND